MIGLRTSLCRWPTLLGLAAMSLAAPALAGDDPAAAAPQEQAVAQASAEAESPVAAAGLVAYIDRGNCQFALKSLDAEQAGAGGVIIADNQVSTDPFTWRLAR